MLKEFKKFAFKGNVVDLAIAVIMGSAFGKIVSSLVEEVITPIIGILTGGINVTSLTYTYGNATINYGVFLQSIFDFIIIAFFIFLFVKSTNALKTKEEETTPSKPSIEELLTEIRDLLKEQENSNTNSL